MNALGIIARTIAGHDGFARPLPQHYSKAREVLCRLQDAAHADNIVITADYEVRPLRSATAVSA